jgi:hypothetical protein
MKYFKVSFYDNEWTNTRTTIIIPAKNKTRAKQVTKEAFATSVDITAEEMETSPE